MTGTGVSARDALDGAITAIAAGVDGCAGVVGREQRARWMAAWTGARHE